MRSLQILLLVFVTMVFAQTEQWRLSEITLTATNTYANPFMDASITAVFTGPGGTIIRRPGFWDGSNTWKIRFAPTKTGTWSYTVTASDTTDTGLHGQTGSLNCVAYTGSLPVYKHGFLKVSDTKRHLIHADSTPFWYMGDTHWFMEHEDFDTVFKVVVDKRITQKYTVYQSHPTRGYLSNSGATNIDTLKYRQLDRYFEYISEKGLVHAFGLDCHNAIDYFTAEGSRRVAKYVCARYGAYPVLFFTSQEVDLWGNETKWKNAFDEWNLWDDYNHPATCHLYYSTNGETKLWGNDPEHDLFFLQAGHGIVHTAAHYKSYWDYNTPVKPFLEVESNYEEIRMGSLPNNADNVRKAAYKAIQCGSAGFGYGANGLWNNCFSATDCNCCEDWGINHWSQALNFPGGAQMQYITEFYTSIEWWKLIPRFTDPSWCTVSDGENVIVKSSGVSTYVAYFTSSGTSCTFRNMSDSTPYVASWFNPRNGSSTLINSNVRSVNGSWTAPSKPTNEDWLLLLNGDVDTTLYSMIKVRSGTGGIITPANDMYLRRTDSVRFYINALAGYEISDVKIDSISLGVVNTFKLDSVGGGHTISATFTGGPIPGLIAWWPLNDLSGKTAIEKAAGRNGTLEGGAMFADNGTGGRCLVLNGTDAGMSVADNSVFGNLGKFSLHCSLYISGLPAQNASPVCKEGAYRLVLSSTGGLSFVLATGNNAWYTTGTNISFGSALSTGQWYKIAVVYDGTRLTPYVNGVAGTASTSAISGSIIDNSANITFGSSVASNINFFNGKLSGVKFFSTVVPDTVNQSTDADKSIKENSNFPILHCEPNPFNPVLSIRLSGVRTVDNYIADIYNMNGQKIHTVMLKHNGLNSAYATWNGSAASSGLYYVQVNGRSSKFSKKVLLIK